MLVEKLLKKVENAKVGRSRWCQAVKEDAEYMLDELLNENGVTEINLRMLEKTLLNGASSWLQYSEGGCAYCSESEIIKHYCTPSEIKRFTEKTPYTKGPNDNETWWEVQARALFQSYKLIEENME